VNREPGKRVLFLCYNRSLQAFLKAQLQREGNYRGIEVLTFRYWAEKTTGLSQDRNNESLEAYEQRLYRAMLEASRNWPEEKKYDAIFVDEALDLHPECFRCCADALRGGAEGDLVIAIDGAQSVYGRSRSFTWKSVGVNAQGRTRELTKNYRNTKEIIEFAWGVAQASRQADEQTEVCIRLQPTRAARVGPKPRYQGYPSSREEQAAIARLVQEYKAQGHPETDICVLYPRKEGDRIQNLFGALKGIGEVCWMTNDADWTARSQFVSRPGVRLCTIHSAKGLQFPVTILSAVDQLPNPMKDDEAADNNLFYVGLTRAMDHLVLTWTGRSEFTARVEKSPRAVRLDLPSALSQA
jgi:superfamily I DNA/RNA helicase